MHAGDLGVFQDCIGGLMYVEMANRAWHGSFAHGVKWLNDRLKEYYTANPGLTRIHLTVSMIRPKDVSFPTLRSKAAECRHLSGFAVFLAHRHRRMQLVFRTARMAPYSAEYRELAVLMAENMHSYHQACSSEPFDQTACRNSMVTFIKATTDLRSLFRRDLRADLHDSQPFIFRVKGHMLDHLVNRCIGLWGSPKLFWCYGDEDFVGIVKRIAVMTRHPRTLERVLLQKCRLYAALHGYALRLANE